jgi:predicted MarR family transcription regulator
MPRSNLSLKHLYIPDDDVDSPQTVAPAKPSTADKALALSEIEFGMASVNNAFHRWIVSCMSAADLKDLGVIDVLVLHHVNHRAQNKRLADICFILNIEDSHVVGYSLRKLISLGVVKANKNGKEVTYSTTPEGQTYLSNYQRIREQRLLDPFQTIGLNETVLKELAQFLRKMSGLYDQAARAASSL